MEENTSPKLPVRDDGKVSKAFTWFHATSVNGGAMAIAATIASYF